MFRALRRVNATVTILAACLSVVSVNAPNAAPRNQTFFLQPNSDPTLPDPRPSLFTVIREPLGMKLVPSRGMFKRIVVDDAQRPTKN
jgi:uncharacterized protein (TIGR03435 family)